MKKITSLVFALTYFSADMHDDIIKSIGLPPRLGSIAQSNDEAQVMSLQRSRTQRDCEQATKEYAASLTTFFGPSTGILTSEQVDKLSPLLGPIQSDADYFIHIFKNELPRPRPYAYVKDVVPCLPKEKSLAFPSGHATLARLLGLIIGEILPNKKPAIEKRAAEIGRNRILGGVHHPSDVEAGFKLADKLFLELKKNSAFTEKLRQLRI